MQSTEMLQPPPVTIQTVRSEHYGSLARFFEENNTAETVRQFNPFPLTSDTARAIACGSHRDHYYVVLLGDSVVGLSMLRGWDEGHSVPSFGILLDQRLRGQGIGRKVLEFTMKEAEKLGCRRLRLSVYASNAAAKHLYESVGFRTDVRERVCVAGELDEKIVMFRDL